MVCNLADGGGRVEGDAESVDRLAAGRSRVDLSLSSKLSTITTKHICEPYSDNPEYSHQHLD
jgi:hypothetical protein